MQAGLQRNVPGRKREWYVEASLNAEANRRNNQFVFTLQSRLSGTYAGLLARLLFVGERESIVSSFVENAQEYEGSLVRDIMPLWLERAGGGLQQLNLTNENLAMPFPFLKTMAQEIAKCKP